MNTNKWEKILAGMLGHSITVVNPQRYTPTLTGYKIEPEAYKARVVSCEDGILKLLTSFLCDPHKKTKEKAFQFVPIDQIKRVMISESQRLVTL